MMSEDIVLKYTIPRKCVKDGEAENTQSYEQTRLPAGFTQLKIKDVKKGASYSYSSQGVLYVNKNDSSKDPVTKKTQYADGMDVRDMKVSD